MLVMGAIRKPRARTARRRGDPPRALEGAVTLCYGTLSAAGPVPGARRGRLANSLRERTEDVDQASSYESSTVKTRVSSARES